MKKLTIFVRAQWDSEAEVWVATSDDLPGLITEAETQQALVAKLQDMIPDLLEDGGGFDGDGLSEIPVVIMSEQLTRIRLRA